jgi:hypothetical protein
VTEAWGRFLPLLRAQIGEFLIYALFILLLHFLLGVAIVMVGILTCCVGAVLFALPLIGTVLLLPVWTTYRAFSVEFLGQFGEDFRI